MRSNIFQERRDNAKILEHFGLDIDNGYLPDEYNYPIRSDA